MPRIALTDATIRALPTPSSGQTDYWDKSFRGFGIRCSYGGAKTFILKKDNRRFTFGPYPIISLKDARELARQRLAQKYLPQDASIHSQEAIRLYLTSKQPQFKRRTLVLVTYYLEKHVPHKKLNTITTRDIIHITDQLSLSAANHAFSIIKSFFNWCVERQHLEKNPLERTRQPYKTRSRDRVLNNEELQKLWLQTRDLTDYNRIVRSLLLTGQRLSQLTHFQHHWLNHDTITFPASIMKNGADHTIPLTPLIREHLPNLTKSFTNLSTSKTRLDGKLKIPHWTLHDLRRTFSTKLAELGVQPQITERILNHTSGTIRGVAAVYNRYAYQAEMRDAMLRYEKHMWSLVSVCTC